MNRKKVLKEIKSYVFLFLLVLAAVFFMNQYVYVNTEVPTGSMEPLVKPKDRLIVNRIAYLMEEPKRGDVVMFHAPKEERTEEIKYYLKRIIGLPGEEIEMKDGMIYINGNREPLKEEYLKEKPEEESGKYEVPEGCYFMLGDNRNDSNDSRYWTSKYVPKEEIIGKIFLRYYPEFSWFP